ncbi:MFS transporter [Pseudoroseomonas wenyumeiae]
MVAEILLFAFGRRLTEALGIRGMMLLGAFGGLLRWGLLGATTWLPALVLAQLLHAATFGAQYLGAMRLLQRLVPPEQASTAQTLHASLGGGLGTGLLTLACGPLYAAWGGAGAFGPWRCSACWRCRWPWPAARHAGGQIFLTNVFISQTESFLGRSSRSEGHGSCWQRQRNRRGRG